MNRPAVVVFGWAGFNALLTVILVGYSYTDPFPLIVYMGAVLLVGGYGTAVLVAAMRDDEHERAGWLPIAARSTSVAFLAIGITLIGLGFCYGLWLMPVALYPLLLAGVLLRRERLSSVAIRYGRPPGFDPATGRTRPRVDAVDLPAGAPPIETSHERTGGRAAGVAAAGLVLAVRTVLGVRRRRRGDR